MKLKLTVFLFLLFNLGITAQVKTDKRLAGIEKDLNQVLKDFKVAGFSVAVVEGDKIIYSQGFGYRDYENKKPVTPNTLFAIGSCSKAFTSSLIGKLEKDGKLSFDKKAIEYLPQLHFNTPEMNNNITVRDMMCHRTGLSRYDTSWYLFNSPDRANLLERVQFMEPNATLREKWQYNNFMFLAQGMIAEKLTGKSWEDNIKESFFENLEMIRSNTNIQDLAKDNDASFAYDLDKNDAIKKVDYFNISGMGPAGSINSSVNEMANWVSIWLNDGKFKGKEILPANYIKEATSSQMVVNGGQPTEFNDIQFGNYGFGWILQSYRGHYRVEHGGNIDGFSASTCFFPSDKIGIVVLTNQNSSVVPSIVRNIIADRILKLEKRDWAGNFKKKLDDAKKKEKEATKEVVDAQIPNTKPSHPLADYQGNFSNPVFNEFEVFMKNDVLYAQLGTYSMKLKHYHYDIFKAENDDKPEISEMNLLFNFKTGNDGKIESISLLLEQGMKPFLFTSKPKAIVTTANELQKYIGDYDLTGIIAKVYVKDNTLFLLVPGQLDYETIAIGNNTFKLKALEGYSIKFDEKENQIIAVNFIQPNGTFKATKKK